MTPNQRFKPTVPPSPGPRLNLALDLNRSMNPFRIYLRSELGKLKNHGDASWFLESIQPEVQKACGFEDSPTQLVNAFSTQENVDTFVQSLSDDQVQVLTKSCDEDWRNNGVFNKLSRHPVWSEATVPVGLVDVQQAESQLAHIFVRHGFRLTAIVGDPELWTQKPYAGWSLDAVVPFRIGLGQLGSGRYKLFDGIHRAILLCRQGAQSLELCFYEG
jgi:hypothetical protein